MNFSWEDVEIDVHDTQMMPEQPQLPDWNDPFYIFHIADEYHRQHPIDDIIY